MNDIGNTDVLTYTVQEGESLLGVAMKHNMSSNEIKRINSLYGMRDVYPGQILKVFNSFNDLKRSTSQESKDSININKDNHRVNSRNSRQKKPTVVYHEEHKTLIIQADLCVRRKKVMTHIEGTLTLAHLYVAFKHTYAELDHKVDYNFLIAMKDVRDCEKLYIGQHKANELDVEDKVYVQIIWENERLGFSLSSIFFRMTNDNANNACRLFEEILQHKHRDLNSGFTSGKCLSALCKIPLGSFYEFFATLAPQIDKLQTTGVPEETESQTTIILPDTTKDESSLELDNEIKLKKSDSGSSSPTSSNSFTKFLGSPLTSMKDFLPGLQTVKKLFSVNEENEQNIEEIAKDSEILQAGSDVKLTETPLWVNKESSIITSAEQLIALKSSLPVSVQSNWWKLVYNFELNGVSLKRFYDAVEGVQPTLMIIKTTNGYVFGCYATESWSVSRGKYFYGTGETFVFNIDPIDPTKVNIYPWTKKNNNFMNSSSTHLSIGSGGDGFAFCVDSELEEGTSCSCETYGNPSPLCSSNGEKIAAFKIVDIEVFGFDAPKIKDRNRPKPKKRPSFFRMDSNENKNSIS